MNDAQAARPLTQKLSEDIIAYIFSHHLSPGDRLPNEQSLAGILGVGRSSVREAMKLLASRNVVDIRQGSGSYVSDKQGVADDPFGFLFVQDKYRLAKDLMAIRFLIEPEIAALAARSASPEQIEQIGHACRETEALLLAGRDHAQADIAFHTAIALSTGNLVIPRLVPVIDQSVGLFIDLTKSVLRDETIETHREIARAIAAHDDAAAHDAMVLHLVYNRRCIRAAEAGGTTSIVQKEAQT